jgi:hypothetical protein
MARPARVFMRARNPCLRLRRRVLGWKVRFVTGPRSVELTQTIRSKSSIAK